ncbi:MAG TPA: NAD(P)-dependent oxidoreductase [Dongiaceae bacterium]|jgi:3-hydroxyisobutyrate dehydrogenase
MTDIAFLGLGAMGSRMAANLVKAGHRVTVWNRSSNACDRLVALGAKAAVSPREAAANVEFVIAMVRDDEASQRVWLDAKDGALTGMRKGAVAVESSTVTPDWSRALGRHAAEHGVGYLEAPVAGTLPQAEAGQLIYLVGGDTALVERATPILKAMGSPIHHTGVVGTAALAKLTVNTLLALQVAGLAELIPVLKRAGVDAKQVLDVVAQTPVWSPVATRTTQSMLAGAFQPMFPVNMMAKDMGYTLAAAGDVRKAPLIAATRQAFTEGIERGLGDLNMTALVQIRE